MSGNAATFQPLPQAPTAAVPAGITADGAARSAWQPNVFQWLAVWRFLVVGEGLASLLIDGRAGHTMLVLQAAALYAVVTALFALKGPQLAHNRIVLVADLACCIGLLALANEASLFTLMALYSYSTVVSWAADRPIDAFIAGGIGAAAYSILGVMASFNESLPTAFVSNLALYVFFALATSGFFTVARRIGALEIAAEITKERGRYRRDLHDRLGQALCGLHFELQALHSSGLSTGVTARLQSLADGYRDARVMLNDLFRGGDEPLVATNVAALIQQEARKTSQQTGAAINVLVDGEPGRIPAWMRGHIWSIAGEATTNALKNGEASNIDIDLSIADDLVVLSVTDNGVGFDCPPGTIPEKLGHYGLKEMQERAQLCGGEVVVASAPGFGTRVRMQAAIPDTAGEDIIERDASRLRENVWSLFTVLRVGLGSVALLQLLVSWGSLESKVVGALVGLFILADVGLPMRKSKQLFYALNRRPGLMYYPLIVYGILFTVTTASDTTPYFMLYAPLLLLAAGVHGGRRLATTMTLMFCVAMLGSFSIVSAFGFTSRADSQTTLLYVTNMLIIGMSATQGAKLLDRLEALQIRVRYQAIARLRHGLSLRMRDQLIERLDGLERETRGLAETEPTPETFSTVTDTLQNGSSELKARLREIVHQLADPTPGRTTNV